MTITDPFTRAGVNRRTLLKAAGTTLGLAALGGTAACSKESGGGSGGGAVNIDPSERVELPEPLADVPYPDPYVGPKAYERKPFADGSKTFRVVVPQNATVIGDWNKNEFSAWLEERTGLTVEYQAVNLTGPDGSQDMSKINAMLSSGDLPDAFMSINFSDSQISLYGQQGIFQDLSALSDAYAPMHRQMLSEIDKLKQVITANDGKIYQQVAINDCYHCRSWSNKTFMNTKYLEKIGAALPETTDDFRNVLREMKASNPSGKDGVLAFLGLGGEAMDIWFVNPFTYNPGEPWLRVNNGKVEFVANTDGWRQGMAYMRSLFDDETLTKQSFSIDGTELAKLGDQGLIGTARVGYWGSFLSIEYDEDALWYDYDAVMPLVGPDGNRVTSSSYYTMPSRRMVITSACENPELLVQWADYQMDLEAILRGYGSGGEKGENWDWAEKGEKGLDGRQASWKVVTKDVTDSESSPGHSWDQESLMYRSLDFRNGQYADPKAPNFEDRLRKVSEQYEEFRQPEDQELPPLLFDETTTATISDLATTISNHVTQSMAQFATAGLDINDDAVWNDYVGKLDQMNLGQYLELYQKAYDERPQ